MNVLCVAEKPSISKEISRILSGGQRQTSDTGNRFVKNYEFDYPQTRAHFIVTCVSGHLTGVDFPERYKSWQGCDPGELFDVEPQTFIKEDNRSIERNLMTLARRVDTLMIWTDCDREGEHIGMEIANVCRRVKPNIRVQRARFSAIIAQQIHRAAQHPVELDRRQADAVDARIKLDLVIGAAFTRLQTNVLGNSIDEQRKVLSFGPCQFPTLGFVVERFLRVRDFRPETFWYIHLELTRRREDGELEVAEFKWKRGHLFDNHVAISIYKRVLENSRARVTNVIKKETKKWKPYPLTTVELQKAGSRLLRMSPAKVLASAEKLYQKGFVSYPRTETDQFDDQFDLMSLIAKQTVDPAWGAFATRLQNGEFMAPRKGKNNDKAHPPIHPTAHASNLDPDEKKVYEYIVRRYLACCSKDAIGNETTVHVVCGGEEFSTSGLIVLERNYLEVYPYDKWTSKTLPTFERGEEFDPSSCMFKEGQTSAPKHLTEADLVTLMDKNGIGTDATIASHIETIINRDYVVERMEGATKYLVPSTLGIGLIEGYNEIGLPKSVSKPSLRRETERRMVQVCEGTTGKAEMLRTSLDQYKQMFQITKREFRKVENAVRRYVRGNGAAGPGPNQNANNGPGGGGGGGGGGGNAGNGNARPPRGAPRGGGPPRPPSSRNKPTSNAAIPIDSDDENPPPPPAPRPQRPPPAPRSNPAPTSRVGAPDRSRSSRQTNVVMCNCGIPAVRSIATGGLSAGRARWGCSKTDDSACLLFQWVDADTADTEPVAGPSTVPAKRPYANAPSPDQESRACSSCGKDAVQRTVMKDSDNKGRYFWKCADARTAECEIFFEWADEPSRPKQGAAGSTSMGSRTASGGSGSCFKCNEEGHWASACPNGDGGMNKRPRSFGASGGGSSTPTALKCFVCQEPGHFAPDCPNKGSTSRGGTSKGGGADPCYKCQKPGHWAKDCPGGGGGGGSSYGGRSGSYGKSSGPAKRGGGKGSRGGRGGKRGRGTKKSSFAAADDF